MGGEEALFRGVGEEGGKIQPLETEILVDRLYIAYRTYELFMNYC